jgi:hypothetical protein
MLSLDFKYILKRYLPWFMRKPITLAIINVISNVLKALNNNLVSFRNTTREFTSVTASIIHFEYYFNTLLNYDPVLKGIYIENLADITYFYVRNKAEERPKYIYNKAEYTATTNVSPQYYLKNSAEFATSLDYIVWVPTYVTFDMDELISQIERYNLAGKIYEIRTY